MVRTTGRSQAQQRRSPALGLLLALLMLGAVLVGVSGCSKGASTGAKPSKESSETTTPPESGHMAGPDVTLYMAQEIIDSRKPKPWNLGTPQSAVRSYLAWVSYAYRIGQSAVSTPTMSPYEEVRVDSYNQYNLQKSRLLDQTLESITFGASSKTATGTQVPTKESWTYSYLSVDQGNPVIEGPYPVKYDCTYTVIKNDKGDWVVDSVKAKAQGKVK